jgi:hypothetical protein
MTTTTEPSAVDPEVEQALARWRADAPFVPARKVRVSSGLASSLPAATYAILRRAGFARAWIEVTEGNARTERTKVATLTDAGVIAWIGVHRQMNAASSAA